MTLHISPELEQELAALARKVGREPESMAAELLDAAVQRYNAKLAKLRTEIQAADASPDAADGAFDRVRERLGLPAR